jgi:hypothetical protein
LHFLTDELAMQELARSSLVEEGVEWNGSEEEEEKEEEEEEEEEEQRERASARARQRERAGNTTRSAQLCRAVSPPRRVHRLTSPPPRRDAITRSANREGRSSSRTRRAHFLLAMINCAEMPSYSPRAGASERSA